MRLRAGLGRPGGPGRARDVILVVGVWLVDLVAFFNPDAAGSVLPDAVVPALAATVAVPLLWRRERPVVVFGLVWFFSTASLLLTTGYRPIIALWVTLFAVAACCASRQVVAAVAATAVPAGLSISREVATAPADQRGITVLVMVVLFVVITAAIFAGGRYQGSSQRALRDLERRRAVAASEAVAAERLRIARELHDIVAHAVGLMALQAAGAARVMRHDPGRAERALEQVGELGLQAVNELHRMLGLLEDGSPERQALGHAEVVQSPAAGVLELAERVRAGGREVSVLIEGAPVELDPSLGLAAYRIVQESLTNGVKYGRPDAPIDVVVRWGGDRVELVVTNFVGDVDSALSTGRGLVGMKERARALGGHLEAGTTAEGVFEVHATLPVARVVEQLPRAGLSARGADVG